MCCLALTVSTRLGSSCHTCSRAARAHDDHAHTTWHPYLSCFDISYLTREICLRLKIARRVNVYVKHADKGISTDVAIKLGKPWTESLIGDQRKQKSKVGFMPKTFKTFDGRRPRGKVVGPRAALQEKRARTGISRHCRCRYRERMDEGKARLDGCGLRGSRRLRTRGMRGI